MKIQLPYNRNRMRNKYIALQIQWGQQTQGKKIIIANRSKNTREKKSNRTKENKIEQRGERKEWSVERKKKAMPHTIDIIVKPWAGSTFTKQW